MKIRSKIKLEWEFYKYGNFDFKQRNENNHEFY